jgi:hypothetical protein
MNEGVIRSLAEDKAIQMEVDELRIDLGLPPWQYSSNEKDETPRRRGRRTGK